MPDLIAIFPITVLVAVLLFLTKEGVEAARRWRADSRKIHALKTLLARECELNLWTIKSLRRILVNVPCSDEHAPLVVVRIEPSSNRGHIARIQSIDGGSESVLVIPEVHRDLMSKYLLDVATLDKALFDVLEPAYDGLAELDHVRKSLLCIQDDAVAAGVDGLFGTFADYALDEIKDTEMALSILYRHCTGRLLETHRIR